MESESLVDLISNRGFDSYQNGLSARFKANHMDYHYYYGNNEFIRSFVVTLGKNNTNTKIVINEIGILVFGYNVNEREYLEEFKNCNTDDFHTMLAHAFIYVRDGIFEFDKDWYNKLEKNK